MKNYIFILLLFVMLLPTLIFADTLINSCGITLSSGGTRYYLEDNLTSEYHANCIEVTANNVILDCQGNTIYVNGTSGKLIYGFSTTNNFTLMNCNLINNKTHSESYGINLRLFSNVTIDNVNVTSNYYTLYLSQTSDYNISNSNFYGPNNVAVNLYYVDNISITNSNIFSTAV